VQPIYYPVLLHARAALDLAADVYVDGATVSPELPPDASRWPHRVADLAPFTLVDAAATVSANNQRVAVTLVNRGHDPETAELLLRDFSFDGPAAIRTVTAGGEPRVLPDVAAAHLEEGSETTKDGTVVLTLPPQSFTVIEAAITTS
jgi:hypothetical protein